MDINFWNWKTCSSQGAEKQRAEKNPAYVWAATRIRRLDSILWAVEDTGHTRVRPVYQRYRE